MMNSFLLYNILFCMFYKAVDTQVSISADKNPIENGDNVTLTCSITSFSVPALWVNNSNTGTLTSCRNITVCTTTSVGRYDFSASSSTIVAKISQYDDQIDNFGWKCQHSTHFHVFIFNLTTSTTSQSSPTTTPADVSTTSTITTSTLPPAHNESVQSTVTTNGSAQSMKTTTSCPPPVPVIVGVTVGGFLSILVIIFICCCCCPCCCLYHCRMKQNTTNDKENCDNFNESKDGNQNQGHDADSFNKTKAGIQNKAHAMTNVSRQSSASDKYKDLQSVGVVENTHQSVAL